MNKQPKFPEKPPTELRETEIPVPEQKQEKMDKAVERITKEIETLHTSNPEKYDNKAFMERCAIFLIQCGANVLGKSPLYIVERMSAAMNATAPKAILDRHEQKQFEEWKNQWMKKRFRT
jgi:hypothetical protein